MLGKDQMTSAQVGTLARDPCDTRIESKVPAQPYLAYSTQLDTHITQYFTKVLFPFPPCKGRATNLERLSSSRATRAYWPVFSNVRFYCRAMQDERSYCDSTPQRGRPGPSNCAVPIRPACSDASATPQLFITPA